MEPIQIFLRIKDREDMEKVLLNPILQHEYKDGDILWESAGEYYLEAFQCGSNPSICSIEKDHRIRNPKEEIALLILDEINKIIRIEAD
ncbi:MAG: hypothetical protein KFF73_12605 [Cyclobacteriaceae bacterium]|nr:hypothetical protein [Cyclobacteriaceae bacterium]